MSYYHSLAKLYSSPQNILSSYEKHCFMKSILYSWKKQPLGMTQDSDYERNELSDPIYYSSDEYYTSEENIYSDHDDEEEINIDEEFSFREYFGMLESRVANSGSFLAQAKI